MTQETFSFDNTTYNTVNLERVRLSYEHCNWTHEVTSIVTIEFKGGHLVSHDYGSDENKAKEVYDHIRQIIDEKEKPKEERPIDLLDTLDSLLQTCGAALQNKEDDDRAEYVADTLEFVARKYVAEIQEKTIKYGQDTAN